MVTIHFDASDVRALAADFYRQPPTKGRRAQQIVRRTAAAVERDAQVLCPVDTGFLRGSISTTSQGFSAEIGPTASYGGYVEFGTSRMSPEPYMRPALDRNISPFEQAMSRLIQDLL